MAVVRQCSSVAVWQCDSVTVWQCGAAVWCGSVVWQAVFVAVWCDAMRCSVCRWIDVCWIDRLRFDEVGLGGAYIVYQLVCVSDHETQGLGRVMTWGCVCMYVWEAERL